MCQKESFSCDTTITVYSNSLSKFCCFKNLLKLMKPKHIKLHSRFGHKSIEHFIRFFFYETNFIFTRLSKYHIYSCDLWRQFDYSKCIYSLINSVARPSSTYTNFISHVGCDPLKISFKVTWYASIYGMWTNYNVIIYHIIKKWK